MSRYATYDDLAAYCELSANPVGELVLYMFGAATPERIALSDCVCTGLQLAEHWQDVGEDFRRGRIYLPQEDLERFGVARGRPGGGAPARALRRTAGLRGRARPAPAGPGRRRWSRSLAGRARLAVAGYVGGGRAALDAIERVGLRRAAAHADAPGGAPACSGDAVDVLREAR